MFFDGTTDTLASFLLSSITWQFQYGLLRGEVQDAIAWQQLLVGESGEYLVESPITGFNTTFAWYRDSSKIHFTVISVTK